MANPPVRTAASLLVECLAAERCEYIFSVPREETMDDLEALRRRDAVVCAQSFGLAAFRPASAADFCPTLMQALDRGGPTLVEVPIDDRENLPLTERLGALSYGG